MLHMRFVADCGGMVVDDFPAWCSSSVFFPSSSTFCFAPPSASNLLLRTTCLPLSRSVAASICTLISVDFVFSAWMLPYIKLQSGTNARSCVPEKKKKKKEEKRNLIVDAVV